MVIDRWIEKAKRVFEEAVEKRRPKADVVYYDDIYERVFGYLRKIKDDRNILYGDNWAFYSVKSNIAAAYYKCDRAMMTRNKKKQLDDLLDALNYLVFAVNQLLDEVDGDG